MVSRTFQVGDYIYSPNSAIRHTDTYQYTIPPVYFSPKMKYPPVVGRTLSVVMTIGSAGGVGAYDFTVGTAGTGTILGCSVSYDGDETVTVNFIYTTSDTIRIDLTYYAYASIDVSAKVADTTKASYNAIPTTVVRPDTGDTHTVTHLTGCFKGCTAMTTAPTIPSSIISAIGAFEGCTSLQGNVASEMSSFNAGGLTNIFSGTTLPIYIINKVGTDSSRISWLEGIQAYGNVHYEANDNPAPSLSSFTATRVASNGATTPAEQGLWAYLTAQANVYQDYLPVGWSCELSTTTCEMDGSTQVTTQWDGDTGTITMQAWANIGDLSAHDFSLVITAVTEDDESTVKATRSTATLTTTLPKAYALVDYYHDPVTGTEGFAVGKYAEHADLFDVAMPSLFEDTLTAQDMTAQEVSDFVDGLNTGSGAIYTKNISVTFSSGVATLTESGVTTSTRVIPTRLRDTPSSLILTAMATANNTIKLTAWNSSNAGANYSGTIDVTLLIDNR